MVDVPVATWNIATINNNPFEYWVSSDDKDYERFIIGVETVLETEDELLVNDIFTDAMFSDLRTEMSKLDLPDLDVIEQMWNQDYKNRKAIRDFLKDKRIGEKRLASMPDRITNTISLNDGSNIKRPTLINAYNERSLYSVDAWWEAWKDFMFNTYVEVFMGKKNEVKNQLVCFLIGPIQRNKYPAVTLEEQAVSVQLQILLLAILDAIFIYIANRVSPGKWEEIRKTLCHVLIDGKDDRVCQILAESYDNEVVLFLQEVSAAFVGKAKANPTLSSRFGIFLPSSFDGKRNQNSIILISEDFFDLDSGVDVTDCMLSHLEGNFVAAGDLFALSIEDKIGKKYLLVSFHGDSNGLSTRPVLTGLDQAFAAGFQDHLLICGLDANTISQAQDRFHHGVDTFRQHIKGLGMISVWDREEDRFLTTTCSARTSLQMQLNKAVSFKNRFSAASVSLKDWIVAYGSQVDNMFGNFRDNTGARRFVDESLLPTTNFPSDHAIVGCTVCFRENSSAEPSSNTSSTDITGVQFELPPSEKRNDVLAVANGTLYDYWGISENVSFLSKIQDNDNSCSECFPDNTAMPEVLLVGSTPTSSSQLSRQGSNRGMHNSVFFNDFMKGDASVWILFCCRPLSTAICKGWFQAMIIIMGLFGVFDFGVNYGESTRKSLVSGLGFRLRPHECCWVSAHKMANASCARERNESILRSGKIGLRSTRVKFAGPEDFNTTWSSEIENGTLTLTFTKPVTIRGFAFESSNYKDLRELPFSIDVTTDGKLWSELNMPAWWLLRVHTLEGDVLEECAGLTSSGYGSDRDVHVEWDFTLTWHWWIDSFFVQAKSWALVLLVATLGYYGAGRTATVMVSTSHFLNSVVLFGLLCFYSLPQNHILPPKSHRIPALAVRSMIHLIMAAVLREEGHYLIDIGFFTCSVLVGFSAYVRSSTSPNAAFTMAILSLSCFCVVFTMQAIRMSVRAFVNGELVKHDRKANEEFWNEVLKRETDVFAMKRLSLLTARWREKWAKSPVRQPSSLLAHRGADGRFAGGCSWKHVLRLALWAIDSGQGTVNLETLYKQAQSAAPFLNAKAHALAKLSKGRVVSTLISASLEEEAAALSSTAVAESSQGINVKPWARAMEKLLRSYGGDPLRVLDCCRITILFHQVGDLLSCMEYLDCDPEVSILRVRNVVVNLRFTSQEAQDQAIGDHICELQLTLEGFAALVVKLSNRCEVFGVLFGREILSLTFHCVRWRQWRERDHIEP